MNVSALDVPPPGAGVETVTDAVPTLAISAAVIAACRLDADAKVVGRALPFHSTVEDEMKFEPETVRVNAGPPAVVLFGASAATDGAEFGGVELPPEPEPEPPPHPANTATHATAISKTDTAAKRVLDVCAA